MQHQKMSMSKKKFRIGDLAKELKLKKYVIRFWEKEFDLDSDRSDGGQRFYTQDDLDMFIKIKDLLYGQGFTISGAKKQLNLKGATVVQDDKVEQADQSMCVRAQQEQEILLDSQDDESDGELVQECTAASSAEQEQIVAAQAIEKKLVAAEQDLAQQFVDPVEQVVSVQAATVESHELIGVARKEQNHEIVLEREAFLQQLKDLKEQLEQFKQLLG